MVKVVQRLLIRDEALLLINDIQEYPDLIYVSVQRFLSLPVAYVAEVDGQFAGVCGVYEFGTWIKLCPLVALKTFHGMGIGRKLIERILIDFPDRNAHISSSNIKVQKVVLSLGFTERESFFSLPNVVKKFLFGQLMDMISIKLIVDSTRKFFQYKRGPMRWYVRYNAA